MNGQLNITVHTSSQNTTSTEVQVEVYEGTTVVATHTGTSGNAFQFTIPSAKLWSPDSPHLYNLTVTLGGDKITSYTGFRTISRGVIDGIERPLLNGEFIFMIGTLDQGYWPDGLYTPPNREAMVYDLEMLKGLGFNMLRKHVSLIYLTISY